MRRIGTYPPAARLVGSGVIAVVLAATAVGSAGASPTLKPPLVTIQRVAGTGVVFIPNRVRVPVVTAANCSDTDYSVMIGDETFHTVTITLNGQLLETLGPAEEFTSCAEGAARFILKLKGHPGARLAENAVVPGA